MIHVAKVIFHKIALVSLYHGRDSVKDTTLLYRLERRLPCPNRQRNINKIEIKWITGLDQEDATCKENAMLVLMRKTCYKQVPERILTR